MWQCDDSKSSGLDGFNLNFIKNSWESLKEYIMSVVIHLQNTGNIPKECNDLFITLVSKVWDPLKLDHFRPISFLGALYKIISKVLSCRLQGC